MKNHLMYIHSSDCPNKNIGINDEVIHEFHLIQGYPNAISRLLEHLNGSKNEIKFLYKKDNAEYDGGSSAPWAQLIFCGKSEIKMTKAEFFKNYINVFNQQYPENKVE